MFWFFLFFFVVLVGVWGGGVGGGGGGGGGGVVVFPSLYCKLERRCVCVCVCGDNNSLRSYILLPTLKEGKVSPFGKA